MSGNVGYIFAIVLIVLIMNLFIVVKRIRNTPKRKRTRMNRGAIDEAKQALWRDKEVARRIERSDADAYERHKLRNETLALYDEVRRRAAERENEEVFTDD